MKRRCSSVDMQTFKRLLLPLCCYYSAQEKFIVEIHVQFEINCVHLYVFTVHIKHTVAASNAQNSNILVWAQLLRAAVSTIEPRLFVLIFRFLSFFPSYSFVLPYNHTEPGTVEVRMMSSSICDVHSLNIEQRKTTVSGQHERQFDSKNKIHSTSTIVQGRDMK